VTADQQRKALGIAGASLVATALFFHRVLLNGEVFLARDMLLVYLPLRFYWAQRILSGSFPDWYPYDGLGQPFTGMVISAVFHPLNALYLLLPPKAALNVNVLLCFPAAFCGVYRLGRRFGVGLPAAVLGGTAFAFSGPLVSYTNNLGYLMAAATVPWALWGADRFFERPSWGRASLAGALGALVLLAGDLQAFALTLGLFGVLGFCRRARWTAVAAALASAMAASTVQLLPAWQGFGQAHRGQQGLAQATLWSTHPLRLVEVLLGPLFARDPDDALGRLIARRVLDSGQATLWMDSLYLGLPVVVLALVGGWAYRRSRAGRTLALCTGLLLLLALGKRAGLTTLAFHVLPFWRAFRYPEKWMVFVSLGLALGAAAGFQAVLTRPEIRRWAGRLLGLVSILALAVAAEEVGLKLGGRWMATPIGSALGAEAAAQFSRDLASGAAVSGALAALAAASLLWGVRPRLVAWSTPACCFLGLLGLNEPRYQVLRPDVADRPSPFIAAIQGTSWRVLQLSGPHREPSGAGLSPLDLHALGAVLTLEPVTSALFGLEGANTYLPASSARVVELSDDERAWVLGRAGLFGARYLSVAEGNAAAVVASGKRVVETLPSFGYDLIENPLALPRAYVARPVCVAGPAESLAAVQAGSFVPGVEAVVECGRPFPATPESPGDVLSLESTPERTTLRVQMRAGAVVVLNDAFYSGWRATLDGEETPLLAANHAVRAVFVPPGLHEVVFRYRTPGLWLGLGVTLAFLLGGIGAGLLRRPQRRAKSQSPGVDASASNLSGHRTDPPPTGASRL
jgi:hypothetical protein